jgi:hypothetical protein
MVDLYYNGNQLVTRYYTVLSKRYNASSGAKEGIVNGEIKDCRNAKFQNIEDYGPIPEGRYSFSLAVDKQIAQVHWSKEGGATLVASWKIQRLPETAPIPSDLVPKWRAIGSDAVVVNFAVWGLNRVALYPVVGTNLHHRPGGFYIHDSTKGYSHGCIEVDTMFFSDLHEFIKKKKYDLNRLFLTVKYPAPDALTSWELNPPIEL